MTEPTKSQPSEELMRQVALLRLQESQRSARSTGSLKLVFVWIPLGLLALAAAIWLGVTVASSIISI